MKTQKENIEFFNKHNYLLIKEFIPRNLADFLYHYGKTYVMAADVMVQTKFPRYNEELHGAFGDQQVPNTFKRYGDPVMDALLLYAQKGMEKNSGMKLQPTYSYWRLYKNGDILRRHKDRPSCEISTTLCLGYDISNMENKDYNWPMFVEETGSYKGLPGKPVHMQPGDMIIYKGALIDHWREPFEGRNHCHVFLHYNNLEGPYGEITKYDTRPFVALPGDFVNIERRKKIKAIHDDIVDSRLKKESINPEDYGHRKYGPNGEKYKDVLNGGDSKDKKS